MYLWIVLGFLAFAALVLILRTHRRRFFAAMARQADVFDAVTDVLAARKIADYSLEVSRDGSRVVVTLERLANSEQRTGTEHDLRAALAARKLASSVTVTIA